MEYKHIDVHGDISFTIQADVMQNLVIRNIILIYVPCP